MRKHEETTIEHVQERLVQIMTKFSGKSETGYILRGNTIDIMQLLNILECSLNAQKEELDRLRKTTRQTAKKLDFLSQQSLI